MILQNSLFTFFPSSALHSKREEDDKPVVPPKTEADANVRDDKKDAKLSSAAPSGSADSKDDKVRTDVCPFAARFLRALPKLPVPFHPHRPRSIWCIFSGTRTRCPNAGTW